MIKERLRSRSRTSSRNHLLIQTIPFLFFNFILFLVAARLAQCFISLSLVSEEIALQMRLIHFLHAASGERSRGGLPEWWPQYFHVLICPPRVWRWKSLFSSSAQGQQRRQSGGKWCISLCVSSGENWTSCIRPLCESVCRRRTWWRELTAVH